MKATQLEFRYRAGIIVLLYLFGFLAPWARYGNHSAPLSTAWLELAGILAGTHWLTLRDASLLVTWVAVLLAFAGAALRVWSAACFGPEAACAVHAGPGALAASGPYRYLRHPLDLGLFLCSAAVAILMPPSGAVFFLIGMLVFELRLIRHEEARLAGRLGAPYLAYCRRVPRLVPRLAMRASPPAARPLWLRGVLAEIGAIGVAFSFALLAWRYNAQLLTQAVIICFGLSLVSRAFISAPWRDAVS